MGISGLDELLTP